MQAADQDRVAELHRLMDDYRNQCLWFLRDDYYPESDAEALRVLDQVQRHSDVEGFRRAGELRQWLLRRSSETSAG